MMLKKLDLMINRLHCKVFDHMRISSHTEDTIYVECLNCDYYAIITLEPWEELETVK